MSTEYLPTPEEESRLIAFEKNEVALIARFMHPVDPTAKITPVGSVPKGTFLREYGHWGWTVVV